MIICLMPPPPKGIVPIIVTWFLSPVLTGLAAALLFIFCRTAVLRRRNAPILSFWLLPPLVVVTLSVSVYFVLTKVTAMHPG